MIIAEVVNVTIDNYTLFTLSMIAMWTGMIFFELRDINRQMNKR